MLLQNKNTLNQSMAAYGKKFKNQPLKNFLFICIVQQNWYLSSTHGYVIIFTHRLVEAYRAVSQNRAPTQNLLIILKVYQLVW